MTTAAAMLPLFGVRVIELAGLAPVPHCGMILADFGADVVKVDRVDDYGARIDRMSRGKRSIAIDLKKVEGVNVLKRLCSVADVLLDPYRPGVLEKLGLDMRTLSDLNSKLIVARLSGYGQTGPWRHTAGHDINYLSLSGLLSRFGRKDQKPTPPINLAADFAGGGLTTAFGIVVALFERTRSGRGQVIDTSMVEGAAYVGSFIPLSQDSSLLWWNGKRGENLLDSGSPIYDTYETSDKKYVAVGCLEPKFLATMLQKLEMDADISHADIAADMDKFRAQLESKFRSKTRDQWAAIFTGTSPGHPFISAFSGTDACVTPVLELHEAAEHEQSRARNSFIRMADGDIVAPRPAPTLSRTPARTPRANDDGCAPGEHSATILGEFGFEKRQIETLVAERVITESNQHSKL